MREQRYYWDYYITSFSDLEIPRRTEVLREIGARGWELVAIDRGVAYFKCPRKDHGEEEAVKEARSEENTDQPQRVSAIGELYSRAYE